MSQDPRRSERQEGWTVPIDRVAAFTSGAAIAVEPEQIESELARYWQRATERARTQEGRLIVSRAILWNLVVCVSGEAAFQRVKTLVDEVAESVPARVIVLYTHRATSAADSSPFGDDEPLRAFIEANVRDSSGIREVLGEEITLEAPQLESRRLPGLMRALLLPDLPTALFVAGGLPEGPLLTTLPVVADADRLIIDSWDSGLLYEATGLRALCAALPRPGGSEGPKEMADLGWLRLAAWRGLLASLFDAPEARAALAVLDEIRVRYTTGGAPRAQLLGGWLVARLGLAVVQVSAGDITLRDGGGRTVRMSIEPGVGRQSPAGIDSVCLRAGEREFVARGEGSGDTRALELLSPVAPRRVQPVHDRPDAELLIAALNAPGRDPLMYEALCHALALLPAETAGPGCTAAETG